MLYSSEGITQGLKYQPQLKNNLCRHYKRRKDSIFWQTLTWPRTELFGNNDDKELRVITVLEYGSKWYGPGVWIKMIRAWSMDQNDPGLEYGSKWYGPGVWIKMIRALSFNSLISKFKSIITILSPSRRSRCQWHMSEAAWLPVLRVRIPLRTLMFFCCVSCVLCR
jgi:hypothetical protein